MALTTVSPGLLDTTAQYYGFKNRIINGAMVIDQRNAGAATSTTNSFSVDRWYYWGSQVSKGSVQQNAGTVTPPSGFQYYMGFTSSSAYSVLSGDFFGLYQKVEGVNVGDLNWGTSNAQTVTLSFWVRSSLTGIFGGSIQNSAQNRSYPFTFSISSANTWEQKTVTIPGDTTGTWLSNNGVGLWLTFGLGVGSTYSGTAGSWAGTTYVSATGATSVVGTNGATFYITGVQLEKGSTATSFDYRPYGQELAMCQRYFQTIPANLLVGGGLGNSNGQGFYGISSFPVTMRAAPTATYGTPSLANCTLTHSASVGGRQTLAIYNVATLGAWAFSFSVDAQMSAEL
jgi:hypothetical protein